MGSTHFSGPVYSTEGFVSEDGITQALGGTATETIENKILKVTITSAQLLALNATPVSIIEAPGANKAIIVNKVIAYKASGTAYAGVAVGEDIVLRYTDGSGTILTGIETTGFLDQATAQTRVALLPQSAVGTVDVEVTPTANAAVVAHMTTGEITTGNSDLILVIDYSIVPTVLS